MDWRFWSRSSARLLSAEVKKAVVSQFHLDTPAMEKLRCVGKSGHFAGRRVHYIRLYDASMMSDDVRNTVGYDQLQLNTYLKALQFQGHIEKNGAIYLTDRRSLPASPKAGQEVQAP